MELFEQKHKAISDELNRCTESDWCIDILSRAEDLEIHIEWALAWRTQLPKLCRDFRWRGWSDDLAENTDFVARIEALERRWDRLQVAAAGYSWSKNFPLGLPPPQLPREILLKILWSHVADTHEMTRKQWHEQAEFALSCALVSKDWNVAATHLLYRGYIRLYTIISTEMLLRTLENEIAPALLGRCSALQILQVSTSGMLRIRSLESSFVSLRKMQLRGVSLRYFAPMLAKLPNLTILTAEYVKYGMVLSTMPGKEPHGASLKDIPPPTYCLEELNLKGMMLTPEQVQ